MTLSARVSTRIDASIRDEAAAKLKPMGLTLSAYIRLAYAYVAREKKLPPGFEIPDAAKRQRHKK